MNRIPGISLLDHVYEPEQLLDPDAGLPAAELAGELGQVLLGEGVALLEDADEVRPGAQVGHVEHVREGRQHLHLVQNLGPGAEVTRKYFVLELSTSVNKDFTITENAPAPY